ncbi:MAG: hypothetical protein HC933_21295, partial [Pleurocapsa sp. SU_196_0]|nr:hypothetical protein [Pleurocapsa sp. SU_196_0]
MTRERLRKLLGQDDGQGPVSLLRGGQQPQQMPTGLRVSLRPSLEHPLEGRIPTLEARGDLGSFDTPGREVLNTLETPSLETRGSGNAPSFKPPRAPDLNPKPVGDLGLSFARDGLNATSSGGGVGDFDLTKPNTSDGDSRTAPQQRIPAALSGFDPGKLSVGQWMSVLNKTLTTHDPPKERYDAVADAFERAPSDLKLELRSRFMTAQNPNSAQTHRLVDTFRERDQMQLATQNREALRDQNFTLPQQNTGLNTAFNPNLGRDNQNAEPQKPEQEKPEKPQLSVETTKAPPAPP